MQVLGVPVISVSRETAEWGIFHPFSQATTGQEKDVKWIRLLV